MGVEIAAEPLFDWNKANEAYLSLSGKLYAWQVKSFWQNRKNLSTSQNLISLFSGIATIINLDANTLSIRLDF